MTMQLNRDEHVAAVFLSVPLFSAHSHNDYRRMVQCGYASFALMHRSTNEAWQDLRQFLVRYHLQMLLCSQSSCAAVVTVSYSKLNCT